MSLLRARVGRSGAEGDELDFWYYWEFAIQRDVLTVLGCIDKHMAVKVRKECKDPGKNTARFTVFYCLVVRFFLEKRLKQQ